MKRIGYNIAALVAVACTLGFTAAAQAQSVNPNGAKIYLSNSGIDRLAADCVFTSPSGSAAGYPALVTLRDEDYHFCPTGFANQQVWEFSEDGGATEAAFGNTSDFTFSATMVLDGDNANGGEAGVNIAPWWFRTDGRINIRIPDGEIAAFGGRMPFYSWTDPSHGGLHYVKGTPITLTMTYHHNGLSSSFPATIEYDVYYNGTHYPAGPFALDEGNEAENPPHGLWGILDPAHVGGFMQDRIDYPSTTHYLQASYSDIKYTNWVGTVPTEKTSWGKLKSLYR